MYDAVVILSAMQQKPSKVRVCSTGVLPGEDPKEGSKVSKGDNSVNETGSYDPGFLLLDIYLTVKHIFVHQKYVPTIHNSNVGNIPKLETIGMPINRRMDK